MAKERNDISLEKFLQELGQRVSELFNNSEFKNQTQLHLHLDKKISPATISDLLGGKANISAYNLMLILKAIKGSADYVIFGKKQQPLLSEFQAILDKVKQEKSIGIKNEQIRELILLLTEDKNSHLKLTAGISKILKMNDERRINSLITMIEIMAEGEK